MNGEVPSEVDHINRDRADNRWSNLRACTRSENLANRMAWSRNGLGLKGVGQLPSGKFKAEIRVNKKTHYLGVFGTAEEAHAAYVSAASVAFGKFAAALSRYLPLENGRLAGLGKCRPTCQKRSARPVYHSHGTGGVVCRTPL